MKHLSGFGLMEMMVALLIGALIVLMAGQVYVASMKGVFSQERTADDINRQIFATDGLAANLRLAGLGIDESVLSYPLPSGILIHQNQLSRQNNNGANIARYMTGRVHLPNDGTNLPSDQLTIIYRAPQDMWNCEGEMVLGPRRARLKSGEMAWVDGQVVIERYFIQNDDGVMNLRCDAAKFITENIVRDATRDRRFAQSSTAFINAIIDESAKDTKNANVIYGFGEQNQGQIMAHHVEGMWVRLGVQEGDGVRLVRPSDYDSASLSPIVSLDVAWLSHSPLTLPSDEMGEWQFEVFGEAVAVRDGVGSHDRRLHQLTVQLRNIKAQGGVQ